MKKRHRWEFDPEKEVWTCIYCFARKRKVTRRCPTAKFRSVHTVWEYQLRPDGPWIWVQAKDPVPPCPVGGGPR